VLDKLEYGLFVLSAHENQKDNSCITNVAMQVTDNPIRIAFTVNKNNLTHDMIFNTGKFTLSILTTDVPMELIQHFGFKSGREVEKFENYPYAQKNQQGMYYITEKYANAYISGTVFSKMDLGTHTLFLADVIETQDLSEKKSLTYEYYHQNIKPQPKSDKKKAWVCKVCGYVHEDENLPQDVVCPWCQHGVADFELMEMSK
jgi:flavin reductase (DIM6/NTAB) family NADH-FMN oxidoreductase RutF